MLPSIANAQTSYGTNTTWNMGNYPYNDTNYNPYGSNNGNYNYGYTGSGYYGSTSNPLPRIYLVNPNTVNKGLGSVRIAITGDYFVPGAIAKLNGIDQITTYVNSSRIEMQLNDLARMSTGNFIVNVYNPSPGGGFSNSATLNISDSTGVSSGATVSTGNTVSTANKTTTVAKKSTASTTVAQAKKAVGNPGSEVLGASVLFGVSNFLPTNLVQWLIFLIFILLLIYLWRKIYITEKDKSTPLKHH